MQEEQEEMQVRARAPSASSRVIGLRVMSVLSFVSLVGIGVATYPRVTRSICLGAASYSLSCGVREVDLFMLVPCLGWKIDDAHACLFG